MALTNIDWHERVRQSGGCFSSRVRQQNELTKYRSRDNNFVGEVDEPINVERRWR